MVRDKQTSKSKFTELRKRAQIFLEARPSDASAMTQEDIKKLVHELDTYQIELELQNEDLRQSQIALEKTGKKFSDLYDFAPVGYLTVSDNGLIVEANLRVAEMLGVERGKLLKQPLSAFIVADDQDKYYKHRRDVLDSKKRQSCELRILINDKTSLDASLESAVIRDVDGESGQFRICIADISAHKKAKDDLRKSKEEWEKTFNFIPDIVTLQDKNMCIVRANKAAHDFFAKDGGDLVDHYCFEVFRGLTEPCRGCPLLETLQNKSNNSAIIQFEESGKVFFVSSAAITDEDDNIQYLVHIAKDITEQQMIEKKFFQAQKMEAVGILAGGIAHDFNNILSAIMGYAEVAKIHIPTDNIAVNDIDQILTASKRASKLVRQILTFSRNSEMSLSIEPVLPYLIVKEALKMLQVSLPANITIQEDIDPACGEILADPTGIHQIIMNLIVNALHAMENVVGVLKVKLARRELRADDILGQSGGLFGPVIELSVSDTGCGMDSQTQQQIFDPYFTTKASGKGSGLGLSIIHLIVKDCGGMITVESDPGKGTTFHVYFPAIAEEIQKAENHIK